MFGCLRNLGWRRTSYSSPCSSYSSLCYLHEEFIRLQFGSVRCHDNPRTQQSVCWELAAREFWGQWLRAALRFTRISSLVEAVSFAKSIEPLGNIKFNLILLHGLPNPLSFPSSTFPFPWDHLAPPSPLPVATPRSIACCATSFHCEDSIY